MDKFVKGVKLDDGTVDILFEQANGTKVVIVLDAKNVAALKGLIERVVRPGGVTS